MLVVFGGARRAERREQVRATREADHQGHEEAERQGRISG